MQNPLIAIIGFSCAGVYLSLQIADNADFGRFSPGTPLEAVEMRWFFENSDLGRYELLCGSGFNKRRTDTAISASKVAIIRSGLRVAIEDLAQFVVCPPIKVIQQYLHLSDSSGTTSLRYD